MTQYLYNGLPVKPKNGWVMIDNTRMKLSAAKRLEDFKMVTPPARPSTPSPSAEQLQEKFVTDVRAEVARRIGSAASLATQLNLAAAAAGGILTEEQMSNYLAGLSWVAQMRETGKQLILDADNDFLLDEKWPPVPDGVAELLETF